MSMSRSCVAASDVDQELAVESIFDARVDVDVPVAFA